MAASGTSPSSSTQMCSGGGFHSKSYQIQRQAGGSRDTFSKVWAGWSRDALKGWAGSEPEGMKMWEEGKEVNGVGVWASPACASCLCSVGGEILEAGRIPAERYRLASENQMQMQNEGAVG